MPYVYEVSFEIPPGKLDELEIGQSLERLVGYMKVRLPSEPGFVSAQAVYSVDDPAATRVVMRSEWSEWSDLVDHSDSTLVENGVFEEFEPHVSRAHISVRRYAEVGSGPFSVRT